MRCEFCRAVVGELVSLEVGGLNLLCIEIGDVQKGSALLKARPKRVNVRKLKLNFMTRPPQPDWQGCDYGGQHLEVWYAAVLMSSPSSIHHLNH
jgi:hypothetical protein